MQIRRGDEDEIQKLFRLENWNLIKFLIVSLIIMKIFIYQIDRKVRQD